VAPSHLVRATTPEQPLIQAAKVGDLVAVRALLRRRVDVNATEVDGTTALHYAVVSGSTDLVEVLLKAGANARAVNRYGMTPMIMAASQASPRVLESLLAAGADANTTGPGGETALMLVARNGNPEAIRILVARGANVNAREPGKQQTALMWAAAANNVAAIRALVEAGADLRLRSKELNDRIVRGGSPANDFVGAPGEIPFEFTPLLFAVLNGHIEATRTLLDLGADPNDLSQPDKTTALVIACINAHWELASMLLDRGADPNGASQGWTPLHQVARTRTPPIGRVPAPILTGHLDSFEFAKQLIAHGADVNAVVTKELVDIYRRDVRWVGATAFFIAAKGGDVALMRLLAASGADTKRGNRSLDTPLMVAAGLRQWEIGGEAITKESSIEAVRLCLEIGCGDVNAVNDAGNTALHGAAFLGAVESVRMLAEHDAKLDVKNKRGQTPFTWAAGRDPAGRTLFRLRQEETAKALTSLLTERGLAVDQLPPENYLPYLADESATADVTTPGRATEALGGQVGTGKK
jgi:ankyrin repeat protein